VETLYTACFNFLENFLIQTNQLVLIGFGGAFVLKTIAFTFSDPKVAYRIELKVERTGNEKFNSIQVDM